ncbi:hypothetical protein QFZ48_004464 [Chitinophaga sp. W2I13]
MKILRELVFYFFKEGEFKTNDILVVLKNENKSSNSSDKLRAEVLKYLNLRHKNILQNAKLDSIIFVKHELEVGN